MLPARVSEKRTLAKRDNRTGRWKSDAHRDWVRRFACCKCGERAGIEVAHVRIGSDAGIGRKPSDWFTVPLCRDCHDRQHQIGERTFWADYKGNHGQSVEQLIAELCQASPKAREIAAAKRVRQA